MEFNLFKIGYLTITLIDLFDILLVSFVFYKMYTFLRGTIAAQMFIGLVIILVASFGIRLLNMSGMSWIIQNLRTVWVIAFVILFQPEIRRMLIYLGQNRLVRIFVKGDPQPFLTEIIKSAKELSIRRYGALIVLVREAGLRTILETGEILQARTSAQLILSIFNPRSPLHDGAIIIRNEIIEAARCVLPLTTNPGIETLLGTRHRAALGISEQSDAVAIVVSEETGMISIAERGVLKRGLSEETLRKYLYEIFGVKASNRPTN